MCICGEQHHKVKLLIFYFPGKLCSIVCMILNIVYKIGYHEKYCYIYVSFIFISLFHFLPYDIVLAGNKYASLIYQMNR